MARAQKDADNSKKEVLGRWVPRMRGMSPEDQQAVGDSLGSSTGAILSHAANPPANPAQGASGLVPRANAGAGAPMTFEEFKARKAAGTL